VYLIIIDMEGHNKLCPYKSELNR